MSTTVLADLARTRRIVLRDVPLQGWLNRARRLGASLAILTTANYLVWLGWDQRYDVGPGGVVTGPYRPWQIVGLVLGLAVLAGFAGWRRQPEIATVVITTVMWVCFSVDAATQADTYGASFWPIGAALVALGTAGGVAVVAHLVAALAWRQERRRVSLDPPM